MTKHTDNSPPGVPLHRAMSSSTEDGDGTELNQLFNVIFKGLIARSRPFFTTNNGGAQGRPVGAKKWLRHQFTCNEQIIYRPSDIWRTNTFVERQPKSLTKNLNKICCFGTYFSSLSAESLTKNLNKILNQFAPRNNFVGEIWFEFVLRNSVLLNKTASNKLNTNLHGILLVLLLKQPTPIGYK